MSTLRAFIPSGGGVRLTYKDIDDRLRWLVLRGGLWLVAMTLSAWFAFARSPVHHPAVNLILLALMGCACWFVVRKPVEILRAVEVRPDCMILDDEEVFFRDSMESWPHFVPDEDNDLVLVGTYGTRRMEYLTVPRFDENDHAPEILAIHLGIAMRQSWSAPAEV
jgi:hypothetical protein